VIPLVRPATREDGAAIAGIHVRAFADEHAKMAEAGAAHACGQRANSESITRYWTDEVTGLCITHVEAWSRQGAIVVAELDGTVVGYGTLGPADWVVSLGEGTYDQMIHHLAVDPSTQRRSVGTRLVSALFGHVDAGKGLYAWSWDGSPAQQFYRALGASALSRRSKPCGWVGSYGQTAFGWRELGALQTRSAFA